mmetsp:Transcript_33143/g.93001  ORF Transcript_33143/g.93001 Transcript_33143/m.93001 type:complete len:295 (-) Transcript_33143:336-1220(-)
MFSSSSASSSPAVSTSTSQAWPALGLLGAGPSSSCGSPPSLVLGPSSPPSPVLIPLPVARRPNGEIAKRLSSTATIPLRRKNPGLRTLFSPFRSTVTWQPAGTALSRRTNTWRRSNSSRPAAAFFRESTPSPLSSCGCPERSWRTHRTLMLWACAVAFGAGAAWRALPRGRPPSPASGAGLGPGNRLTPSLGSTWRSLALAARRSWTKLCFGACLNLLSMSLRPVPVPKRFSSRCHPCVECRLPLLPTFRVAPPIGSGIEGKPGVRSWAPEGPAPAFLLKQLAGEEGGIDHGRL